MDTLFSRYRNLSILAIVLFAQVLVLAFQVRRPTEAGPVRLARVWAVTLFTPLEKAVVHTQNGISNTWHDYVWLRSLRKENDALRNENERMRLEQIRLAQDAAQARRLQSLLQFKEQTVSQTVAAQVIGSSGTETSRTIYIDKGTNDGVHNDMSVITSEGVIGKVLRAFSSSSQVLLLTDPSSGVGAILNNSRLQGILKGTPAGELVLNYIMSDEKVAVGEQVLTSGGDRVFPKGMPLGVVTQVSPGPELFLNIRVKPAAQISKLEEVLVITKVIDTVPVVTETSSGPVRAADILAQRLPTITVQAPDAETSKKETSTPLSMAEWIRRQKQQQQQQKQGATTSPSTTALKNPAGVPPAAAVTAAPKAGGAPPSAGSTSPKPDVSTPRQARATGQTGNAQPTVSSTTPLSAPKTAAPKKQPDTTQPKPASPSGQPPATPPGVTL